MEFFNFLNKKEAVPEYTEQDLENADREYREAATALNAIDMGDESISDDVIGNTVARYKQASKKYQEIHRALHPEEYQGENEQKTILPNVELNEQAQDLDVFGGLAEE